MDYAKHGDRREGDSVGLSSSEDSREAMAKRVEEARQRLLAMKEEALKKAPELTEQLLLGEDFFGWELVSLKSGTQAKLKVYALSEGNLLRIFKNYPSFDLTKIEMGKDWEVMMEIASLTTKTDRKVIEEKFVAGSSLPIATHALRLSGYGRSEEVKSFLDEATKEAS